MYISDLAEEYLLTTGEWAINPNSGEYKNKIAEALAKKQWERESIAFAAGYVKCLETFNEILKRYYNVSFREVHNGNPEYINDLKYAETQIEFITNLKVNPQFDIDN